MADSDTDGDSRDGATDGARQHDARQAPLTARELQPRRAAYKGNRVPGKSYACRQPRAPGRGGRGGKHMHSHAESVHT